MVCAALSSQDGERLGSGGMGNEMASGPDGEEEEKKAVQMPRV